MQPFLVSETQAWAIGLACTLMLIDVVSGFIAACVNNEISSTTMRQGLLHKVLMLLLIVACLAVEIALGHAVELPYNIPTCEVVCGYIVIMELISTLENIAKGYPQIVETPLFKLFDFENKGDE